MFKRYGIAVGLTIIAGVFIMASVLIMVAGQTYGREITEEIGSEWRCGHTGPGPALLLVAALSCWPWASCSGRRRRSIFRSSSSRPGAVFFVILWLLFTSLFGLYVANFGSYNATYGTLGGVVVLLVWIYFSSFIFLIAAQVNAILAKRETPEAAAETEGRRNPSLIGRIKERIPFIGGQRRPEPRSRTVASSRP